MVRATFRIRSCARAEKPMRRTAISKRALAGIVERGYFPDQPRGHMGVVESPGLLHATGLLHAATDLGRRGDHRFAAQFFEGHGRNFHVNIDAVEQRFTDFVQVLLDLSRRAAALPGCVAQKAALTCVHVTNLQSVNLECRAM
jgi:hypothetical protein